MSGRCIRSRPIGASAARPNFAPARLLGALEALRHGITTIQDMNSLVPQDEETLDIILAAYAEVGIRVVFSIAVRDLAGARYRAVSAAGMPAEVAAIVGGKPGDAKADLAFIARRSRGTNPLPARLHWAIRPSGPQRCSTRIAGRTRRDLRTTSICRSSPTSTRPARSSPRRARSMRASAAPTCNTCARSAC